MTDRQSLFRAAALEAWARGRDQRRGFARLGAPWISLSYRLLLALTLATVALAFVARTDESTSGPASVDGSTGDFSAALPASAAADLSSALRVSIDLRGSGPDGLPAAVSGARLAGAEEVAKTGLHAPSGPAILVAGRVTLPASVPERSQLSGRLTVVIRSERVVDLLAQRFGSLLGVTGGQQ